MRTTFLFVVVIVLSNLNPVSAQTTDPATFTVAGKQLSTPSPAKYSTVSCVPVFSFDTPDSDENGIDADGNIIWVTGGAGTGFYKTDCTNGAILQTVPMPSSPSFFFGGDIDYFGGFIYYINEQSGTLFQIDPTSGTIINQFTLSANGPNGASDPNNWGIACEDNFFWNSEYALGPQIGYGSYLHKTTFTGTPIDSFFVPHWILPIKLIGGQLWGAAFDVPWIYRFDKTTGAIIDSIDKCLSPCYGLTLNAAGLWLSGTSSFNNDKVHRFNFVTGIEESVYQSQVSVFPQPASDLLYFSANFEPGVSIKLIVTDLQGKIVANRDIMFKDDKYMLDISEWSQGVYGYQLFNGTEIKSGEFVKM